MGPADRLVAAIDRLVVEHTRRVVLVGLVLTLVFAIGFGNVSTESGTSQFTEGSPSEDAYEAVREVFGPTFTADTGSTTLIVQDRNVLSKRAPAVARPPGAPARTGLPPDHCDE